MKSLTRIFNIFVFAITVVAYLSTDISPEKFWIAGFLALSIPLLLLVNIFFLIFYLIRRKIWVLFPLVALLLGYKYLQASFPFNWKKELEYEKKQDSFSVLNYNVRVFNSYAYLQHENNTGKSMIQWVANNDADVKCLQEFYNEYNSPVYDTFSKIRKGEKYHTYIQPSSVNRAGAQFGLAIFSKFPMVSKGEVLLKDDRKQHAIYADLLIGQDTVRVYNVHLQSMSIDENKIGEFENLEKVQENYITIARKLKSGFISRARQVDNLISHIRQSPYRVIICGDFNDIPYSYTYSRLKKHLYNAFEEAGSGLGFSYNGKLFFLRIDSQFFSQGLEVQNYNTHREIPYSDHYPVRAVYHKSETDL